jgi:hypothetical protein
MAKKPKVASSPIARKRRDDELSVAFSNLECLEHAVFATEISLIMLYCMDVLEEMYGEKGGRK